MTTTPPENPPQESPPRDSGPRVLWDDVRDLGRIRRSRADRRVAGVAGGLGRHLDIDPIILRVAFVVLTFFGGVGLLLYVALWLLVPEDGSDWARIRLDRRSRTVALVIVGTLSLLLVFSNGWWGDGGFLFLCLVVVLAAVVISTQLPHRGDPSDVVPRQGESGTTASGGGNPTAYMYVRTPQPPHPRRRGPILFWFGLALMAVALGVLGIIDLAGAHVVPSAYPALVLALSGVLLLVGTFFGRAGGLILVGLLAAVGTAGATVGDHWHPDSVTRTPTTAAAVQDDYHLDVGELVVDLTDVQDPQALDGRTIHISAGIGHLDIRVPAGVRVVADADISGPGGLRVFGRDLGGAGSSVHAVHQGDPGAPTLTIDAHLHVGAIDLEAQ